jgi:protein-disulfide isomerase
MINSLSVAVSERDHLRGPESARLTLVEYGDFACPFCAQAYPVVRELLRRYPSELRFVFRHNPRGELHEGAHLAARAAEAANVQDKFWPMHDLLFERADGAPMSEKVAACAAELGLDMQRFETDLLSPDVAQRVREDEVGGLRSGVVGTPTFFINGVHFRDKPDLETLSRAIEETRS